MSKKKPQRKNPAAVALGKRGGAKGGKKRIETTSQRRLSEIGFIGSVYGRMSRGIKVSDEDFEKALRLQRKNKK
jgi:hypothetical protein